MMLQTKAIHSHAIYGIFGSFLVCRKGSSNVMNVSAALLKLPPKAVADGDSVCTMVNWQMLYMKENTPERKSQRIVDLLYSHVHLRISQSVIDGAPMCCHSPGTGLEMKKMIGSRKAVAGRAM